MAKKTTRKCQKCGQIGEMEDMKLVVLQYKKPVNKFYHSDCYDEYIKDKEFKEKEAKELDKLVDVIKKIYGVKIIPNTVYPYLQDLRNGTKFFGKNDYKYKQGYSYDLIAETFEYCSDTIEYWNRRKSFDGLSGAIRYGLAIVCDKLVVVEARRNRKESEQNLINIHINNVENDSHVFETNYKPKKNAKSKGDFTDFLD